MTIIRIPITHFFVTVGTAFPEPNPVKATNSPFEYQPWIMPNDDTRVELHASVPIPTQYNGSPKIIVQYDIDAVVGDVEVDVDIRSKAVGEGNNQAGFQEQVNVNDTVPGTAFLMAEVELALTASNLTAGDNCDMIVAFDGTDAGHTVAADARVHQILLECDLV